MAVNMRYPILVILLLCGSILVDTAMIYAQEENTATVVDVPAFTMYIRLGNQSGPVVDRALVYGDVIHAQAWVPLMGEPEDPVLANLIWQLYDVDGKPVAGVGLIRQLLEMGGEELVTFKVKVKGFVNGHYYLGLTHQQASHPEVSSQAVERFEVSQKVAITSLVIDESPAGKTNHDVLYVDQSPHIFVYYTLADSIPSVRIVLDIIDRKTNKVVATRTVVQRKDYMKEQERMGVRFDPGFFAAGDELIARALLTAADGSSQAQTSFSVQGITSTMILPSVVKQGKGGSYELQVPPSFAGPFIVDFRGSESLQFQNNHGLTGTFQAVGEAGEQQLQVLVVDKNGRRATATASITVMPSARSASLPAVKKVGKPPSTYSVPSQGGMVGSSSPQEY